MADLGSLFGGIAQGAFNYFSNKETNEANAEINKQNMLFNEHMWDRQKEYDSPVNQMKRLMDAGINPAMAYANGVENTVGTAPTSPAPIPMQAYKGNELAELGNRISLDKLRDVQSQEGVSQIRLNDHTILKMDSDIDKNNAVIKQIYRTIDKIGSDIDKNNAEIQLLQAKYKNEGLESVSREIDNWIKEMTKHDKVFAAEIANDKTREEINYIVQQIAVGKSTVRLNNAKAEWTEKDIERIAEDIRNAKFWNDLNDETRVYLLDNVRISRDSNETTFQINLEQLKKTKAYNDAYSKLDNFFTILDKFLSSLNPFD